MISSGFSVIQYLHRAVWPLLMADKVIGGEDHLTDIAVKTCLVPVLTEERSYFIGYLKLRKRDFKDISNR